MAAFTRCLSSLSLCLVLLANLGSNPATRDVNPSADQIAQSVFYPEVRLRKLHLVRPDLIPYPIYYDIYC